MTEEAVLFVWTQAEWRWLQSTLNSILAMVEANEAMLKRDAATLSSLQTILPLLTTSLKPARLVLGTPIVKKKGRLIMANYQLANDAIVAFPILTANAAGDLVPAPSGDTYNLTNVASELNAVIGTVDGTPAGAPSVNVNALVAATTVGSPVSFTLNDTFGLKSVTEMIDIVADVTPTQLEIGTPVVIGSQAVPTGQ